MQIVEEESEAKGCSETEENGSCLNPGEISMSEVLSSILSVPVSSIPLSVHFMHINLGSAAFILRYIISVVHLPDQLCYGAIQRG